MSFLTYVYASNNPYVLTLSRLGAQPLLLFVITIFYIVGPVMIVLFHE